MKREVSFVPVLAAALLIVAAVAFFLLVKPEMDESSSLDDRIAELRQELDGALAARRPTPPTETVAVADVFRLTKAMPDETDMAAVLLELDSVASAAGVELLSITPKPSVPREGFEALPIDLTFAGDYYDLSDFLFRLRNLVMVRDGELDATGRLFTLDAFDLHEGAGGFPRIEAALTVTAYAYEGPADAAAGAAPPATTGTTTTEDASGEASGTG